MVTVNQVRAAIDTAKECSHDITLYQLEDVGYPSGWVERWACLACNTRDRHETGGNGKGLGEFGSRQTKNTRVIISGRGVFPVTETGYKDILGFLTNLERKIEDGSVQIHLRNEDGETETINFQDKDMQHRQEDVIAKIHTILEV